MKVANKFCRPQPQGERGVTMILVALSMVAIVAMAAMSIDLVTLYLAREEAQRTADAAALAAARIISVSGITSSGAPTSTNWPNICGPTGWSTQAAQAVVAQNTVGGQLVTTTNVTVTYSDGTTSNAPDCSALTAAFAVNPMITVQVTRMSIPSFFSRIWGTTANTVSASATAEAFNPSESDTIGVAPNGSVTPVQPRCVKPWIVPNLDPGVGTCGNPGFPICNNFVVPTTGHVVNPGILGSSSPGVVGEPFTLFADCGNTAGPCVLVGTGPRANVPSTGGTFIGGGLAPFTPNLEYVPGSVLGPVGASWAVPSCAAGGTNYQSAVAGCDRTTVYQCGIQASVAPTPNLVDLSEDPGGPGGDTGTGVACALTGTTTAPLDGPDILRTTSYPFVAFAGDANPLGISGAPMTNSNSIVSLPIYDQSTPITAGTTPVTIVGFLQVFVNDVNSDGSVKVTVLNVAGCGNAATNSPVFGNSPLPIRLIQPH